MPAEKFEALPEAATSPLFSELERRAIRYAEEMTRNVQVKQETIDAIRKLLPDQQVVELIGTIAGYNMVSRFLLATGVDLEATQ